jgi:hypothetical protein
MVEGRDGDKARMRKMVHRNEEILQLPEFCFADVSFSKHCAAPSLSSHTPDLIIELDWLCKHGSHAVKPGSATRVNQAPASVDGVAELRDIDVDHVSTVCKGISYIGIQPGVDLLMCQLSASGCAYYDISSNSPRRAASS